MDLPVPSELLTQQHRAPAEDYWAQASKLAEVVGPYLVMAWAERHGWKAILGWGCQGHHLGAWPEIIVYHRDSDERFELAETRGISPRMVVDVFRYPTAGMRNAATDALAFAHWKRAEQPWVEGIAASEDLPPHLRGPFSWERLGHALHLVDGHE